MRLLNVFIVLVFLFSSCQNQGSTQLQSEEKTVQGETPGKLVFEEDFHDFGKLEDGEIVSYSFKFKNEGKSTLQIKQVRASCGCTSPKYTKSPIAPGGEGTVEVEFDSSGFNGLQNKSVRVITNGEPSDYSLHFSATVVADAAR